MARLKKSLRRSQNAHRRLMLVHKKKTNGDDSSFIKMNYHSLCYERQKKENRVLSESEKKKAYEQTVLTFF